MKMSAKIGLLLIVGSVIVDYMQVVEGIYIFASGLISGAYSLL